MAAAHDGNGGFPGGSAEEVAEAAWYRATEAKEIAESAKRDGLNAHEQLGTILERLSQLYIAVKVLTDAHGNLTTGLATQAQVHTERFRKIELRFEMLEKVIKAKQAELEARTAEAVRDADEARSSSHDLQDEVEKMDSILKKMHTIDSVRAQKLIDERFGVLINEKELESLRAEKTARETLQKQIADERRVNSMTTKALIVSGIVVAIFTSLLTYFASRAPTSSTSHQDSTQQVK